MSDLPNPGDLAYIVKEEIGCQENIGAVVEVLKDQTKPEGFHPCEPGEVWIKSTRPLAYIGTGFRKSYALPGHQVAIYLRWLRRIGGPPVKESLTTEVTA